MHLYIIDTQHTEAGWRLYASVKTNLPECRIYTSMNLVSVKPSEPMLG